MAAPCRVTSSPKRAGEPRVDLATSSASETSTGPPRSPSSWYCAPAKTAFGSRHHQGGVRDGRAGGGAALEAGADGRRFGERAGPGVRSGRPHPEGKGLFAPVGAAGALEDGVHRLADGDGVRVDLVELAFGTTHEIADEADRRVLVEGHHDHVVGGEARKGLEQRGGWGPEGPEGPPSPHL